MSNLEQNEEHTRKGASCYECERLHNLDKKEGCKVREDILDPNVDWSNFAAYGCSRYLGDYTPLPSNRGGNQYRDVPTELNLKIREYFLRGEVFKLSMCIEWGIEKTRLHNNIVVLEKRGYEVIKTKVGDDRHYKIKDLKNKRYGKN